MKIKYLALACIATLFLAACTSSTKTEVTDSLGSNDTLVADGKDTAEVYSVCFLNSMGKDSTAVELMVKGDKVTGHLNWMPYEKDSRKGTLEGTIKDDTIRANWTFMQEGMTDTLAVNFLLKGETLAQKPLKFNSKTGREQTDEAAAYTISYQPTSKLHK
jgi:predicted SnoaL-like aldol condensation-catalyzing enzyme